MINLSDTQILKWKRFKTEAKIPTKRASDVGFDIYTIENSITLKPHETRLFSTGLGCIMPSNIWLRAVDRGSTGSRGIHVHCGIIDEQYTGEIFIALNNTNDYPIYFTDEVEKPILKNEMFSVKFEAGNQLVYSRYLAYPITKGICQLIPELRLDTTSCEATDEEWQEFCGVSERGSGKLGSSGK